MEWRRLQRHLDRLEAKEKDCRWTTHSLNVLLIPDSCPQLSLVIVMSLVSPLLFETSCNLSWPSSRIDSPYLDKGRRKSLETAQVTAGQVTSLESQSCRLFSKSTLILLNVLSLSLNEETDATSRSEEHEVTCSLLHHETKLYCHSHHRLHALGSTNCTLCSFTCVCLLSLFPCLSNAWHDVS